MNTPKDSNSLDFNVDDDLNLLTPASSELPTPTSTQQSRRTLNQQLPKLSERTTFTSKQQSPLRYEEHLSARSNEKPTSSCGEDTPLLTVQNELPDTTLDDINNVLREKILNLEKENAELRQMIVKFQTKNEEYGTKLQESEEKLKTYECIGKGDFQTSSKMANSKIVELAKKLREKNSEIEVYKTKCNKFQRQLNEKIEKEKTLEKIIATTTESASESKEVQPVKEDQSEIKKLQDKLSQALTKYHEAQNTNCQLKRDLKLANKWLQQEVGSTFEELVMVNNTSSTWRGRAQVICDLQKKNQELRDKLKDCGKSVESSPSIRKDNTKLENLQKINNELKNNYEELRKKSEIIKARNRVLESEQVILKTKLTAAQDNHEHDKAYIEKLLEQLNAKNKEKSDELKEKQMQVKKLEQELENLKIDLEKKQCSITNLTKDLEAQQIELKKKKEDKPPPSPPPPPADTTPNEATSKILSKLEGERLRLLELIETLNKRLQEERDAHQKTQLHLRQELQRGAKLEASLARMELEQNSARSYSNSSQSRSKEIKEEQSYKDQYELATESLKVLQTRLEIETFERKKDLKKFAEILKNSDLQ